MSCWLVKTLGVAPELIVEEAMASVLAAVPIRPAVVPVMRHCWTKELGPHAERLIS